MHSKIFKPFRIGNVTVKNRIIRSATNEGMADETGRPGAAHEKLYRRLTEGGVGAVVTGFAGINRQGKSSFHNMLMADSDELIDPYRKLLENVRKDGLPFFMQLAHCGRATSRSVTGMPAVAPSPISDRMYPGERPVEMTESMIEKTIDDFTSAAVRAEKCGFDGVQLHLAHGYLPAQFLSPYSNRRKDRWGGSIKNRFRIIKEIFHSIRKELPDYPVFVKLNAYDRRKGGMRTDEATVISSMLERVGCDAIEVSCGFPEDGGLSARSEKIPVRAALRYHPAFSGIPAVFHKAAELIVPLFVQNRGPFLSYNVEAAVRIKKTVSIPVIVTGGIHRVKDIESAVIGSGIDAVSMSRPLILEPDLVNKMKTGKSEEARCIRCNYCGVLQEKFPLRCYYGRLP